MNGPRRIIDPRAVRQHNAAVKTSEWLARLQALSQSSWNRNIRFRTSRPFMPPAEVRSTAAATASGQAHRTIPMLPPTASQRAVAAVSSQNPIRGARGYAPTTVPQVLYHRRHGPNGPG